MTYTLFICSMHVSFQCLPPPPPCLHAILHFVVVFSTQTHTDTRRKSPVSRIDRRVMTQSIASSFHSYLARVTRKYYANTSARCHGTSQQPSCRCCTGAPMRCCAKVTSAQDEVRPLGEPMGLLVDPDGRKDTETRCGRRCCDKKKPGRGAWTRSLAAGAAGGPHREEYL